MSQNLSRMQQIYKLFDGFSDESRVWLYTANRAITPTEAHFVQENLEEFASNWKAHSTALKAKACLLHEYTIAFVVDQTTANASGCSVDSSVRFVKELGKELDINFFNRLNVVVEDENGNRTLHSYHKLKDLTQSSYYNPLVDSLYDLKNNWLKVI
jgi:hypothetical protein